MIQCNHNKTNAKSVRKSETMNTITKTTTTFEFTFGELCTTSKNHTQEFYCHIDIAQKAIEDAIFGLFTEGKEKDDFYENALVHITIEESNWMGAQVNVHIRWNHYNDLLGELNYTKEPEAFEITAVNVLHNVHCGLFVAPVTIRCDEDYAGLITRYPEFHEINLTSLHLTDIQ